MQLFKPVANHVFQLKKHKDFSIPLKTTIGGCKASFSRVPSLTSRTTLWYSWSFTKYL